MSPRARIVLIVAVAAVAAAVVTVGAAALQSRGADDAAPDLPKGTPPVVIELGLRDDPEARRLRRAATLQDRGDARAAERLFAASRSIEGEVGAAVAGWPAGTVGHLRTIVRTHPRSGVAWVNLGIAELWSGRREAAVQAWRETMRVAADTPYAIRADAFLFARRSPDGLPEFLPSAAPPRAVRRLPLGQQLPALERAARRGGVREQLVLGVAYQRVGRPLSARRAFDTAARLAPNDPAALTAAAVGRFRKSDPTPAFARLGPLTRRFPRAAVVRLHLGTMLLWLGRLEAAASQLRRARALEPRSPYGRAAARYLELLGRE